MFVDIQRLMQVLSEIFSDRFGMKITFSATPKVKEKKEEKPA